MKRMIMLFLAAILLSVEQSSADAVIDWNKIANDVFFSSRRPAGAVIVDMAYMHVAIYDAVNAIDGRYIPFAVTPSNGVSWASKDAATAAAAHGVLLSLYPQQQTYVDSVYAVFLATLPDNTAKSSGIAIGQEVANRLLALRANDGRDAVLPYTFESGPGAYQLTPGAAPPPATPQIPWLAHLKPFAMLSPSQFRAPGPPALTSDLFARDFNETKQYGAHDGSSRTVEQTAIGQFYGENPGVQTSRNIRNLASAHGLSIDGNARMFAQIYVTLADAVIAAWDSKYYYNFWRPVTAIRAADTDGNSQTLRDTSWLPLLVTPGHPEYPAAHGCVTGGLAYAIERFFGTDQQNVTLTSTSVAGAPITEHHFTNIQDIVSEVTNARVYGGMHYRTSAEHGAMIGRKVADWVADHYFRLKNAEIPTAGLQLWLRADAGVDTLNGAVSRWHDQSVNGNDAIQANASRQPLWVAGALNGNPVLHFDGADDRLGLTGSTPMSQISLFIVQKADSGATGPNPYYPINFGDVFHDGQVYALSMQNDFSLRRSDEIDPLAGLHQWVRGTANNIAAFGQWKVVSVVTNQTIWNTTVRANGAEASIAPLESDISISVPLGNPTGTGVGGVGGADGVPVGHLTFKGDIAEVIVYNVPLSDPERKAVEHYLAIKYSQPTIPTAGMQLWLKADAGVDTLHGTVSRWHDQSGNGNDAIQANTSRQPLLVAGALNGKPVISFDGVNDKLGFTGTTHMTQFSLFLVINNHQGSSSGNGDGHVITFGANGDNNHQWFMWMQYPSGPNSIGMATGSTSDINASSPNLAVYDQWRNISVVTTGSGWNTRLRWDGNNVTMSPQGSDGAIDVPLGDATGSGGGIGGADGVDAGTILAKCDVAEMIVYNVALSDAEKREVENYFATKYGQSPILTQPPWVPQHANGLPGSSNPQVNFSAFDRNICWGSNSTNSQYLRTTNGGTNWAVSAITGATGAAGTSITALDANTAWVATTGGVFKTSDGGSTWAHQTTAFSGSGGYPNVIHFFDSNNGVCVGDPKNGYWDIYTTTNGGTNWTRVPSGNIPPPLSSETGEANTAYSVGNSFWFATFGTSLYRTTDRGITWTVARNIIGGGSGFGFAFKDNLNGLACTFVGGSKLARTSDGGGNWTSFPVPPGLSGLSNYYIAYVKGTSGSYVITSNNNTGGPLSALPGSAYSNDNGATWTQMNSIPLGPMAFSPGGFGWSSSVNDAVYKWDNNLLAVGQSKGIVESFRLEQNYPNPFNPSTVVGYQLPAASNVRLVVYDLIGREVSVLVNGRREAGSYTVQFNAGGLASGVYFYRLTAGDFVQTKKLLLLR